MIVSRLVVSDEMKKSNLTPRDKGKLRWERIKELDKSGELQLVKSRKDLAEAVGYGTDIREMQRGASWAGNLINRGYIVERVTRFEGGKAINMYSLTGKEPDFEYRSVSRKNHNRKKNNTTPQVKEAPAEPVLQEHTSDKNDITIEKGDVTIHLSLSGDKTIDLVTSLLK